MWTKDLPIIIHYGVKSVSNCKHCTSFELSANRFLERERQTNQFMHAAWSISNINSTKKYIMMTYYYNISFKIPCDCDGHHIHAN